MGGGVIQLSAVGAMDQYLTGNPQITYFKKVYKRHTNFAIESLQSSLDGNVNFGNMCSTIIQKNGDLIHKMVLELEIKCTDFIRLETVVYNNAYAFIDYMEILIDGQVIDKQYGEWLYIWSELTQDASKKLILQEMLRPTIEDPSKPHIGLVQIPLNFWFNNDIGSAFPLISLQHQDLRLNVKFNDKNKVWNNLAAKEDSVSESLSLQISDHNLYCDYIYLQSDERRRFFQQKQEYLIEQVQFSKNSIPKGASTAAGNSFRIDLQFNNPVKELVWVIQNEYAQNSTNKYLVKATTLQTYNSYYETEADGTPSELRDKNNGSSSVSSASSTDIHFYDHDLLDKAGSGNYIFNFSRGMGSRYLNTETKDQFKSAKIQFNGQDRIPPRKASYFRLTQKHQHHSGCNLEINLNKTRTGALNELDRIRYVSPSIYMYNFGLKPETQQPYGTCNFNHIDKANLSLELTESKILGASGTVDRECRVYAVNYNVLRFMSGMAGLAYN